MDKLMILDLPVEIMCNIAKYLSSEEKYKLMQTCKRWNNVILNNILYILEIGPNIRSFEINSRYKIHPEQIKLLAALKRSRHELNVLEAPMGSGKTAVMLQWGLEGKAKSLYFINTRIYTTWINEIKKFGLKISPNPKKTDVLIVHTKYPKHRDLVLYGKSVPKRIRMIVTTFYYLSTHTKAHRLNEWIMGKISEPNKVIVDEAHLLKLIHVSNLMRLMGVRHYWFSASPIEQKVTNNAFFYRVKNTSTKGYPKLNTSMVPSLGFFTTDITNLVNKTLGKYSHIVVFCNSTMSMLRSEVRKLKKIFLAYDLFVFSNTAPTILSRWKNSEKTILFCNYHTSSEGTNFSEADYVIFFAFHSISLEKARQSIGRIRRKNSLCKIIDVDFVSQRDTVSYIRSKLNEEYALDLNMGIFRKKSVRKINLIVKLLSEKYDIHKLSGEDLLRIFTIDHETKPDIKVDRLTLPLIDILTYSQL